MRGAYVAFYGTLMSDFATQDELRVRHALSPVGPCTIGGVLYDMGAWPTLVLGEGVVHGELFEVLDEDVFDTLDRFEEYDPRAPADSSYLRLRVALIAPAVLAWVYVAHHYAPTGTRIESGSWAARLSSRTRT
jgi:gamma-glutamylcyclotransferase (GGCT)/AIG2-like uncharacterized protein YtfP